MGLGFRRLSIIDLGGGHQPMPGPGDRHWIIFNGEIYNYQALRQELVAKGYTFRTHSDTEVILQLYAERGEDCVHALNGMFAFAIWDSERRSLFLARDRMGVKPLYYAETPEAFLFASEIKALFASGKVTPACREDALAEYLIFRQAAGPETLFRGVRSLPPGCTMTVQDGRRAGLALLVAAARPATRTPMAFDEARRAARGAARRLRAAAPHQRRAGRHVLQRRRGLQPGHRPRREAARATRSTRSRSGSTKPDYDESRYALAGVEAVRHHPSRAPRRERGVQRALPEDGVAQRRAARLRQLGAHLRAEPPRASSS